MTEFLTTLDAETLRLDLLGRLLLAALLGGLIGLERERSGKPAGFRTNLLICVGSALLTELSAAVAGRAGPGATADPGRIAAQIVSGIGFLGAGTIIQSRGGVVGLTTAATLWVVAAIGMAVGAQAYVEAVGATLLVMVALLLLGRIEPLVGRPEERLRITLSPEVGALERVEGALEAAGGVEVLEIERDDDGMVLTVQIEGRRGPRPLVTRLAELEGVRRVVRG